jgi:Heterokaryon incompatibility protein (HET)
MRSTWWPCLEFVAGSINQHDRDEKTHQVRMMKDIYAQAQLAAVWLGEEEDGDYIGAERLHDFHRVYFRDDLVWGKELDVTDTDSPIPKCRVGWSGGLRYGHFSAGDGSQGSGFYRRSLQPPAVFFTGVQSNYHPTLC